MDNEAWSLEAFVDSLVVELDKTRETLAVKSINKPLTYTVKDMALELQIFPTFDGDDVRFRTAQPGQEGASKISLQLASITDQQVRATSKAPKAADVRLEAVELEPSAKKRLRRLGVTSVDDLEKIAEKNVDIEGATGGAVDYKRLAGLISKSRRAAAPPRVQSVSLGEDDAGRPVLRVRGENLGVSASHTPVAVLNDELGEVVEHGPEEVSVGLAATGALRRVNDLVLTLDPYCVVRMEVVSPESEERA